MSRHPAFTHHSTDGDQLLLGGVPVSRLAERVGQTPFYAYDRRVITERVAELKRHLPAEVSLNYAIKANPMPAVVQHLAGQVDGFDVASAKEMQVAFDTGMSPERVSFAGPGKTDAELRQAVAGGITVEMESEGEMNRLAAVGERLGLRPRVALRVNPDFELKGSGMRMGGGPQQFGVDVEKAPGVLARLAELDLEFMGFHIFAGSQNLRAEVVMETQEKTLDLAVALADHAPGAPHHVNIGGGFGIPYFPKDTPLDLPAVGANLAALLPGFREKLPDTRVIIELGRYIVGEAGVYLCRVVDRKESRGQIYLVTDGGLHHHLAASGNFGQVIRRNYPVAIANRMNQAGSETVSVVGCLCTPLDLLADKIELPRGEVGDLIAVFQSGAYGLTASPTDFLSHPRPREVLV